MFGKAKKENKQAQEEMKNNSKEENKENKQPKDEMVNNPKEELRKDVPPQVWEKIEELKILAQSLEDEKKKSSDYYEQLARLKAEFDNFRKRSMKEASQMIKAEKRSVLSKLLPVLDNVYRVRESMDKNEKGVEEAVKIVFSEIENIMSSMEVKKMECVGKEFSPLIHEAVMREKTEDAKDGVITKVVSNGYYLGDEVLKAASVVVAENQKDNTREEAQQNKTEGGESK